MSIRKRTWTKADGTEQTAWCVDYRDQHGARRLKTFAKKKDAESWRADALYQVKQGTHTADSASLTIKEAAEIWLEAVKHGRDGRAPAERSTLRQYRSHVDLHIVPALGAEKLSRLTAPRVSGFRDHLLATVSRPLAKKVLTSLKSIIREAQSRGLVTVNAASSVKIQAQNGGGRHKTQVRIPEAAEIKAVLAKLDELATQRNKQWSKAWRRWRALIATAIYTGFRASELRGLPWGAVDVKAGTIAVRQRADEGGRIGSPKTAASHRTVNVPKALTALLRQWKAECPPGALVFPNWQGNVESLANIHTRCWKPLQLAAGLAVETKDERGNVLRDDDGKPILEPKYNFHSLRHFRASLLIADGANPKEVQAELGHSTITVTYDLYGHLFQDEEADQRRRVRAERLAGALA